MEPLLRGVVKLGAVDQLQAGFLQWYSEFLGTKTHEKQAWTNTTVTDFSDSMSLEVCYTCRYERETLCKLVVNDFHSYRIKTTYNYLLLPLLLYIIIIHIIIILRCILKAINPRKEYFPLSYYYNCNYQNVELNCKRERLE